MPAAGAVIANEVLDALPASARPLVAAEDRQAGGEDAEFLRAKIATAHFYAGHILNKVPGLRDSIVEGADAVTALALEAF